jgi:DNA replication and repair protein RecF
MISSIRLKNFRSYVDESFEFEPGVNIIVGPNASGKTNLLDAVLVLCRGSSFKARDLDLIRFNKQWLRLDGNFEKRQRTVKLADGGHQVAKTYELDGKVYKRLSLDKTVPAVFFEPNHLQLISRGPEQRRDYFDDLLARSQAGYKTTLLSYKRTLAQRNRLLKYGQRQANQQLFAWDIRLSELGAKIAQERSELTDSINKQLGKTYSRIAGSKTTTELKYEHQFPLLNYASGMERGFTGCGPHREDIIFYLSKKRADQTASRGESRSLLLALKVFELDLMEKRHGLKPIFLLDDVFSELDGARRQALVKHLKNYQTFITTTDAEAVVEYFSGSNNLIPLSNTRDAI